MSVSWEAKPEETEQPKAKENSPSLLILPIAVLVGVGLIAMTWRALFLGGMVIAAWQVWSRYQQRSRLQQAHLKSLFYQLIQENRGYITPLDWAIKANLPGEQAQQYLNERVREFSAEMDVNDQGCIVYFFPTVQSLGVMNPQMNTALTELLNTPINPTDELPIYLTIPDTQPLIQSELAKRLKVHPSTISKKKLDSNFSEWSQNQDPENIAWQYSAETKLFSQVTRIE